MFLYQQKLIMGGFLARTPKNFVNFVWDFDQWWQARWFIRYATVFIKVLRNVQSWAKKLIFWFTLRGFFVYVFLDPMSYIPEFFQMKDLIKIYICGTFHNYSICGCEVNNFQSFLFYFSILKMAPSGFFLGLYCPTYCSIKAQCLKNPSK